MVSIIIILQAIIYITDSFHNFVLILRAFVFVILFDFIVFNATFSNVSAISWRPVLVVEEVGVPGENPRPWASNW
jgi:hypothetical protein